MKLYPDKENQSSRNVGIVVSLYDETYFYLLKYDIDMNLNELVMNFILTNHDANLFSQTWLPTHLIFKTL